MHQSQQIDGQIGAAEPIAKPSRMDPRDPVHDGDPARLEIAGLVVVGREERRHLGLLRPGQRPLRPHVRPIDAELKPRIRCGVHCRAACRQNSQRAKYDDRFRPLLQRVHTLGRLNRGTRVALMTTLRNRKPRPQVSLLLPTWMEPLSQVRSTATTVLVTRPRAAVLLLISAFRDRPMKIALIGLTP